MINKLLLFRIILSTVFKFSLIRLNKVIRDAVESTINYRKNYWILWKLAKSQKTVAMDPTKEMKKKFKIRKRLT